VITPRAKFFAVTAIFLTIWAAITQAPRFAWSSLAREDAMKMRYDKCLSVSKTIELNPLTWIAAAPTDYYFASRLLTQPAENQGDNTWVMLILNKRINEDSYEFLVLVDPVEEKWAFIGDKNDSDDGSKVFKRLDNPEWKTPDDSAKYIKNAINWLNSGKSPQTDYCSKASFYYLTDG
tara:strand:- start:48 stop:581 length:534 start_codon:yes stop_codon:yes gene_type:complete